MLSSDIGVFIRNFSSWFIFLRWVAVFSLIFLSYISFKFEIITKKSLVSIFCVSILLAISNIFYIYLARIRAKYLREIEIFGDIFVLTLALFFSGAVFNPFSFLYVFHIIFSAILLGDRFAFFISILSSFLLFLISLIHFSFDLRDFHIYIIPYSKDIFSFLGFISAYTTLFIMTSYFVVGIVRTAREKGIKESVSQFERDVLSSLSVGAILFDSSFKTIWKNDLVPPKIDKFLRDEKVDDIYYVFERGEKKEFELGFEGRFFLVILNPVFGVFGEVKNVLCLMIDITQKKLTDLRISHMEKMNVLGILSLSIAHEISNPLSSVMTRLQLLRKHSKDDFVRESVEVLQREVERIERILRGILRFSRKQEEVGFEEVDLRSALLEAIDIISLHRLAQKTRIIKDIPDEKVKVFGYKDGFIQVFVNLGINALEAMKDKEERVLKISLRKNGGIIVEFSDTGEGIPEHIRDKIFQPFFTTKPEGSGLGLFITKNIISSFGGRITFESKEGVGTKFKIFLPF